jgi:pimeloyl-ACP methyl ester carboxylesterase
MAEQPARPPHSRALTGLGHVVGALRNLGLIRFGHGERKHLAHFGADDGQPIPVQVRGTGPPVVLVHGLACSHRHWSAVAGRLARAHRVYAWDPAATARAAPTWPRASRWRGWRATSPT